MLPANCVSGILRAESDLLEEPPNVFFFFCISHGSAQWIRALSWSIIQPTSKPEVLGTLPSQEHEALLPVAGLKSMLKPTWVQGVLLSPLTKILCPACPS